MSIEERIAAILRQHQLTDTPTWANERICSCGESGLHTLMRPGWAGHVASILVNGLGLHQEWVVGYLGPQYNGGFLSAGSICKDRKSAEYDLRTYFRKDCSAEIVSRYLTNWESE